MRINEILTESQHLEEGPILNKIGSAVGKVAGGVAKGVGALAGGIAGIGAAAKKGFAAGKKTVAGADDEEPAADNTANTQAGSAPAAGGAPTAQPAQAAPAPAAAAPAPAASAPAKTGSAFSKLATAAAGGAPADPAAGGTQYAQVKANIDKLDKKGKQRILGLLQKEVGAAPAAPAKPAAGAKTTAPVKPQAGAAPAAPEEPAADSGAMSNMANQLGGNKPNTMANAPVSKTNTAKPGNPNAAPATEPAATEPAAAEPTSPAAPKRTGGKVAGQLSQTPGAIRKREATARKGKQKPAAPDQAEIDASRDRLMGVTSDSIIRTRPMMAEGFSLFRKK